MSCNENSVLSTVHYNDIHIVYGIRRKINQDCELNSVFRSRICLVRTRPGRKIDPAPASVVSRCGTGIEYGTGPIPANVLIDWSPLEQQSKTLLSSLLFLLNCHPIRLFGGFLTNSDSIGFSKIMRIMFLYSAALR
jgi:hypothetical protein